MADKKTFDFVARKKIFIMFPLAIFIISLIVMLITGLEIAIDFRGGTMMTYSYTGEIDTEEIQNIIQENDYGAVKISTGTAINSDIQTMTLSFASREGLSDESQEAVNNLLIENFTDNNVNHEGSKDVSPSTGYKFFLKCSVAIGFSFIVIVLYMGLRFMRIGGWSSGIFALVALLVDVIMVISAFIFFRLAIDANFMVVILTILSYSLNNTIVLYDRIRENKNLYGVKLTDRELVNKSITQSISRTVKTSISTAVAVAVICIVALIFGVTSIISFAFPLLVGIGSGVFSTLCIVGPLWVGWKERAAAKV